MKKPGIYCLLFIVYCFFVTPIQAAYVLPYPSYMPGNKLYKVSGILDVAKNYWYFGSIAKIKYHLILSDKYLVEAKTLFEYKQYLLGVDALRRSTEQFQELPYYVQKGIAEKKDMTGIISFIREASAVHVALLLSMKNSVPEQFQWEPEKEAPTRLMLHNEINAASLETESVVKDMK